MSKNKYFADSYALIELLRANPQYHQFVTSELVCLQVNLAEVIYAMIKSKKFQKSVVENILASVIPLTTSAIISAMKMKYELREKGLSYVDCLGYATAQELNIPFLTGDKAFKDMPCVNFISTNA